MKKKKEEQLLNVNPGTPLVYMGESPGFKKNDSLIIGKIYTIQYPCYGNFNGTWLPAIYLKEFPGDSAFLMANFTHVPRTIE